MKIYEKPMAIVNKFEVEDVIAESVYAAGSEAITGVTAGTSFASDAATTQGVVFQW